MKTPHGKLVEEVADEVNKLLDTPHSVSVGYMNGCWSIPLGQYRFLWCTPFWEETDGLCIAVEEADGEYVCKDPIKLPIKEITGLKDAPVIADALKGAIKRYSL